MNLGAMPISRALIGSGDDRASWDRSSSVCRSVRTLESYVPAFSALTVMIYGSALVVVQMHKQGR